MINLIESEINASSKLFCKKSLKKKQLLMMNAGTSGFNLLICILILFLILFYGIIFYFYPWKVFYGTLILICVIICWQFAFLFKDLALKIKSLLTFRKSKKY